MTVEPVAATIKSTRHSNLAVAIITTANARLHLLDLMEQCPNVLYTDTDSVFYVAKEGEPRLPLGNYIGDLTDELKGRTVTSFASPGSKQYSYAGYNPDGTPFEVTKVKSLKNCTILF